MESDEEYRCKVNLIRKNVKEGEQMLDGALINLMLS
jgi:hypothetical protein